MAEYDADRHEVIARSLNAGIGLIAVGTTLVDSLAGVKLAERYPDQAVWAAVGVHPTDADLTGINPTQLEALLNSQSGGAGSAGKIVAIGETGLDYFRLEADDVESRQLQTDIFEQHILLAQRADLPLIVHCRDKNGVHDAYDHVLTILSRHQFSRFVMHCYSGNWAAAERFLELGGYLSLTGIVTFPKSDTVRDVTRRVPLDRLMVETDAPFLTPEPHRGKRNEPAYVEFVARQVAALRNQPFEAIAEATTDNANHFFSLAPDR